MKCKRVVSLFLTLIMVIGIFVIPVNAEDRIKVLLDGQELIFDVPPQLIDNRTMVPMRKIFESLGRSNLSHSIMGHGKQTGETMRSLTSKVASARKRGSAPYSAAGFRRKIGWRAHLIDRGTGPRYTKTGAYRGFIIPTYFYEKARIEGEKPAMDVIIDGVQRAVARLSNRG